MLEMMAFLGEYTGITCHLQLLTKDKAPTLLTSRKGTCGRIYRLVESGAPLPGKFLRMRLDQYCETELNIKKMLSVNKQTKD
jgi:hypothetical protein